MFHKDDNPTTSCDKVTDKGNEVYALDINVHVFKAKNSLFLFCSIFVFSLIHLFGRCFFLSRSLERYCLENCERKMKLRANNEHFC